MIQLFKFLSIIYIAFFLSACESDLEKAKKLGFESIEQRDAMSRRGYTSMAQYKTVRELGPNYFYKNCKEVEKRIYDSTCKGKKISWYGEINNADTSYGANIKILNDDGSDLTNSFTIDSKSISSRISKADEGKRIEFEGIIGDKNFVSPDIESISYIKLETDKDKELRLSQQKKIQIENAQVQEKLAAEEYEKNSNNAAWLDSKFGITGALLCGNEVDAFLRDAAKYSYKWDDTGWLSTKFDRYISKVKSPGIITYTSNKATFQNGFGAYQRVTITCDYDTQKKKVLNYFIM